MDQYIGKMLDNRYELLERIGTGGMAVVYKARCHRLNRLVAVKILKPELAEDAEFRRRFHDESRAVAMLSHPNIVAVYDVSRSNNLNYIVMELIDGITLKQYMQKRGTPLNWREALHFIIQIVKALGHAHSKGVIHRDIKPHNIMVLRDGSVKVADFGIARLASASHSTMTQEALGSVHYISPEQAKGSHIDGRSDIYSAGVVLYEMITGRLPYEGDSPVAVAIQHINSIPIPPRELNPEVPEALQAINQKAMAPNPKNRYASADAMLSDLEEFRKNPNISFNYTPAELNKLEESKEPTQVVAAAQIRTESEDSIRRRNDQAKKQNEPPHKPGEAPAKKPAEGGEPARRQSENGAKRLAEGEAVRRAGENAAKKPAEGGAARHPAENQPDGKQPAEGGAANRPGKDPSGKKPGEEKPPRRTGNGDDGPANRKPRDEERRRTKESSRRVEEEDDDYDYYDPPRRGFPMAILAVAVILLFIAGMFAFLWNGFFSALFKPVETYEVPNLVGKTMEEIYADTSITDVWHIELANDYVASDEYDYGQVAQQEPKAKTSVKENNLTITVYISKGKEDDPAIRMPMLTGKEIRLARDELINLGIQLRVQEIEEPSDTVTKNYVISTSPETGTPLVDYQTVIVYVSSGPEIPMTTVPTLTRMMLDDAKDAILECGLVLLDCREVNHETIPEGQVVFQSISPNNEVPKGTTIVLQVSKGPAPVEPSLSPSPSEPLVTPSPSPSIPPYNPDDPEPVVTGRPSVPDDDGE